MQYINKQQLLAHRRRVLRDAEHYGVTKAARRHGVSRNTLYRWRDQLEPQKSGRKQRVSWQTNQASEEERHPSLTPIAIKAYRAVRAIEYVTVEKVKDPDFYLYLKALYEKITLNEWLAFMIQFIGMKGAVLGQQSLKVDNEEINIGQITYSAGKSIEGAIDKIGNYKPFLSDLAFYEQFQSASDRKH